MNKELEESQAGSQISSSYVLQSLNQYQREKLLLENACTNCEHAVWRMVNMSLNCYCNLMYQTSYEQSQMNEVIVTICDGNQPSVSEDIQEVIEDVTSEKSESDDLDIDLLKELVGE